MKSPHCEIYVESNSNHLQQIFCGLEKLAANNSITLKQHIDTQSTHFKANCKLPFGIHGGGLRLVINGNCHVYYDVDDAHKVNQDALAWCDFYFKRSFTSDIHTSISEKILPLDLNYMVKPNQCSWLALKRCVALSSGKERIKNILRELDVKSRFSYLPREQELQQSVDSSQPFNVLFMCRLWEPTKDDFLALSQGQVDDRIAINEMRVACIRALKSEFGDNFSGGLTATPYAKEHYPDIVITDTGVTQKQHYIGYVKQFSVCIATTGLSLSIGWKFGEYIALSRAVVSEKLHAQTFGALEADVNYLEFDSVEQCIAQVKKLQDDTVRTAMQQSNEQYYQAFLAPEKLVLHSINTALTSR